MKFYSEVQPIRIPILLYNTQMVVWNIKRGKCMWFEKSSFTIFHFLTVHLKVPQQWHNY